jgi:CRP-like cAMP-binding protein
MERVVDDIRRYLLDQPLVGSLDPPQVSSIRSCTRMACFRSDEFIFHAGDPANEFYLLRKGQVALQTTPSGNAPVGAGDSQQIRYDSCRVTISTLGENEPLGISWLLIPRRWTYDAFALETVSALAIDVDQLVSLCEREHTLGYRFMTQLGAVLEQRFLDTAIQACDLYSNWS